MKQITVSWGGEDVTVELTEGIGVFSGMVGKHVSIEIRPSGTVTAMVCRGPEELMGMCADGRTAQEALDALGERLWKLASWVRGMFAKPRQDACAVCSTRIRTRRPTALSVAAVGRTVQPHDLIKTLIMNDALIIPGEPSWY